MKSPLSFLVAIALAVAIPSGAGAQSEITLLSPDPIKATIEKLVGDFEAKSGIQVKITYGTGVSTRKTVASGQALDVSLLFAPFPEALRTGNIVPGSATVIARLRLALAVQKGAPMPDISTPEAVKRTLLNSGERWGHRPRGARQARHHGASETENQVAPNRGPRPRLGRQGRGRDRPGPLSQRHA
jgi:ABC-type molybdate transport system substrate-binding protein